MTKKACLLKRQIGCDFLDNIFVATCEAIFTKLLHYLFKHQEQEKYFHAHKWAEGDVLMWDNIGTVHNAVPDYGPHEPRYMRRVQVMATKDYARLAA